MDGGTERLGDRCSLDEAPDTSEWTRVAVVEFGQGGEEAEAWWEGASVVMGTAWPTLELGTQALIN